MLTGTGLKGNLFAKHVFLAAIEQTGLKYCDSNCDNSAIIITIILQDIQWQKDLKENGIIKISKDFVIAISLDENPSE